MEDVAALVRLLWFTDIREVELSQAAGVKGQGRARWVGRRTGRRQLSSCTNSNWGTIWVEALGTVRRSLMVLLDQWQVGGAIPNEMQCALLFIEVR